MQTKASALSHVRLRGKYIYRGGIVFLFVPHKKLWSQTRFLKRAGHRKALRGERIDEGAEKQEGKRRRKYHWRAIIWAISGRLLFHPPVGTEGTGRVCLASGWRRRRVETQKEGVEKERSRSERVHGISEPKECPARRERTKGGGEKNGHQICCHRENLSFLFLWTSITNHNLPQGALIP